MGTTHQELLEPTVTAFNSLTEGDRLRFNREYVGEYADRESVGAEVQSDALSRFWYFYGDGGRLRVTVVFHADNWFIDVGRGPVTVERFSPLKQVDLC